MRAGFRHTDGVKQALFSASFKPCEALGRLQDASMKIQGISQARMRHQAQCSGNAEKLFWTKSSSHPGTGKARVTCSVLALEKEQCRELHKASRHGDPPCQG